MTKRILTLAAAAASAILLQAPAAHAEPLCEDVAVSGIVNVNPPAVCVPFPTDTTCAAGPLGSPSSVLLTYLVCIPAVIGSGGA
jgi:hypothetical protein